MTGVRPTGGNKSTRTTRAVLATLAVVVLGLGVAACTGSDNGGVIQGPPPTTGTTTTTVASATTTSTALPGGTLPSS